MPDSAAAPSVPSTRQALWPVVPLLAGVSLLMGATGLQGSLVSLRATAEGFRAVEVGVVASAYFLGFLVGSRVSARWIQRVGHVRAFGAFTSLASAAVLVHVLAVSVPVWIVARLLSGICLSGLVVIIESWLNAGTPRAVRGRVLSTYMTVNLGGYAAGQFLLAAFPIESFELFAIVSVLLSAAMIPVILSRRVNPPLTTFATMPVRELLRRSPAGVTASVMAGVTWGAISAYSAVVASMMGLRGLGLTAFVAAFLIGHLGAESVVGAVSDRLDRRLVALTIAGIATGLGILAATQVGAPVGLVLLLALGIGGATLPLYSVSIALAGDQLEPEEMIAASGTLVRTNGVGAAVGPIAVASLTASPLGVAGFFLLIAAGTAVVVVVAMVLLARDGVVHPRVPYVRMVARATGTVTRSALSAAVGARDKAARKVASRPGARPRSDRPTRPSATVDERHPR